MQSSITWREFLRQTLTLALPITFQQLMLALSSCADTLMLTNVGQNELSAVSLATQFQFIFSLCLAALTLGMSILVASIGVRATRMPSNVSWRSSCCMPADCRWCFSH